MLFRSKELLEIDRDFQIIVITGRNETLKEKLEKVRVEMEAARRVGDLAKMSELQYGKVPDLEKQIKASEEASKKETHLVRNKVTSEEIAEIVAKWTHIPVTKLLEGEKEKRIFYLRSAYYPYSHCGDG